MSYNVAWLEEEYVLDIKAAVQRKRARLFHGSHFLAWPVLENSKLFLEKCNRASVWTCVNLQFGSLPPFWGFSPPQLMFVCRALIQPL